MSVQQSNNFKKGLSNLVSNQLLEVTKRMDCPLTKQAGRKGFGMEIFDQSKYLSGFTVTCQIQGTSKGVYGLGIDRDRIEPVDRTTISMTARPYLRYQDVKQYDTTEEMFLTNPSLISREITIPAIMGIRDELETSASRQMSEHCPVMFSENFSQNLPIKPVEELNWTSINMLRKTFVDLGSPLSGYTLNFNNYDYTSLGNEFTYIASQDQMVGEAIRTGKPIATIAGVKCDYSTYIDEHITELTDAQKDAPEKNIFEFKTLPVPGGKHLCLLRNTSANDIVLRSGDILYNLAKGTARGDGVHLWKTRTRSPLYGTRYSFCITTEAYLDRFEQLVAEGKTVWQLLDWTIALYKIPSGLSQPHIKYRNLSGDAVWDSGTHDSISISHTPITNGSFQNCSRDIKIHTDPDPDHFIVLGDHNKNFLVSPEYYKFRDFPLTAPSSVQNHRFTESSTGLSILSSHYGDFFARKTIVDMSTFFMYGSYAPCLGVLPTALNRTRKILVSPYGTKKR